MPVLLLIVMAVWWFGFRPMNEDQGWVRVEERFGLCGSGSTGQYACVVDGDTVIIGFGRQQRRIRLTGFDAPELDGACQAESQLASTSREALLAWLAKGPFEWSGADDPPRDQYGRELRTARRRAQDGTDEFLADAMIESGLASESGWGSVPRDWCQ